MRTIHNTNIFQTLHGYENGHKLLASNLELDNETKHLMLSMSDSPGHDFHSGSNVCFTGYPVNHAGMYAVSKTWVAHEITRPGCVWTHTLLISYTDLAKIKNLSGLKDLFISNVDELTIEKIKNKLYLNDEIYNPKCSYKIKEMIFELYSNDYQVLLSNKEYTIDDIIFSWGQQWPKLRRSFKFKTWVAKYSINNHTDFDLLLSPNVDISKENDHYPDWVDLVLKCSNDNNHELQAFLWKHGAHLDESRSNLAYLVTCWYYIHVNFSPLKVSRIILEWKKPPISLIKEMALFFSNQDVQIDISSAYLMSSYILILSEIELPSDVTKKIGEIISIDNEGYIKKLISADSIHKKSIIIGAVDNLPLDFVIRLLDNCDISPIDIAQTNFIYRTDFWSNVESPLKYINEIKKNKLDNKTIKAIVTSEMFIDNFNCFDCYFPELINVIVDNFSQSSDFWHKAIIYKEDYAINLISKLNVIEPELAIFTFKNLSNALLICSVEVNTVIKIYNNLDEKAKESKSVILTLTKKLFKSYDNDRYNIIPLVFDPMDKLISKHDLSFSEWDKLKGTMRVLHTYGSLSFSRVNYFHIAIARVILDTKPHNDFIYSISKNKKSILELSKYISKNSKKSW